MTVLLRPRLELSVDHQTLRAHRRTLLCSILTAVAKDGLSTLLDEAFPRCPNDSTELEDGALSSGLICSAPSASSSSSDVSGRAYRAAVDEDTSIEYRGVRIDLAHVNEGSRQPMLAEAHAWIEAGERPRLLTVHRDGVDVSEQPALWPVRVTHYRGPGRLEWVGLR